MQEIRKEKGLHVMDNQSVPSSNQIVSHMVAHITEPNKSHRLQHTHKYSSPTIYEIWKDEHTNHIYIQIQKSEHSNPTQKKKAKRQDDNNNNKKKHSREKNNKEK